jgi:hypothetical protein
MALNTGTKIFRSSWDIIPIPDLVIARVNALGSDQPHQMTFTDRHGRLIGDIEIPGMVSNEDENAHFSVVAPVICHSVAIKTITIHVYRGSYFHNYYNNLLI